MSVYTGPALYADLRDEYLEAHKRLMEGRNAVILRKEDFPKEQWQVASIQLHSHLLFKVITNSTHCPGEVILRAAAQTAWGCLYSRAPNDLTTSKLIRTYQSDELARQIRRDMKYIPRFDFGRHPFFKLHAKPTTKILRKEWTPEDVDEQYERYPESCAEDAGSREARRLRTGRVGARIGFRRNSLGDTEVLIQNQISALRKGDSSYEINY